MLKCEFCKKPIKGGAGALVAPAPKGKVGKSNQLCLTCYRRTIKFFKFSNQTIEDILSVGPKWLNYTRKVKRKSR